MIEGGGGVCDSDILLNEPDILLNLVLVIPVPEKVSRANKECVRKSQGPSPIGDGSEIGKLYTPSLLLQKHTRT
jgi:hypothetical protein